MVRVRAQARLLLGRLETIGLGAAAAAGRGNYALYLERIWANRRRADLLSRVQGRALLRRGQFRRDLSSTWGLKPIFLNKNKQRFCFSQVVLFDMRILNM